MGYRSRILERWLAAGALLSSAALGTRGQSVAYTDEAAFLAAMASMGTPVLQEGFEDDAAWGLARSGSPIPVNTQRSVASMGLNWVSSSPNNGITTGSGAARTGKWGLYSLPHGDYLNGIGDGFGATGTQPLVAIGGWIATNSAPAEIGLELDGVPVDFGSQSALAGPYTFFGAIDPAGFSSFAFEETEGTELNPKYIFGDDLSFGFGVSDLDCNDNGVADALDIASGFSADCNHNGRPDECEIPATSTAPGGPFYCLSKCAADCNDNGVVDACEIVGPQIHTSEYLSPIGFGFPQSFTVLQAPKTHANVLLDFTAAGTFGGQSEGIAVDVNGVPVGNILMSDGTDCPSGTPDTARLIVPEATFNAAVTGENAVIHMVPSSQVDPFGCKFPSYIGVEVTVWVPNTADKNANGIPDTCEAVSYCTAGVSASGCRAQLAGSGFASASASSGFDLLAAGVEGSQGGLFFLGANGRQANPWGNGTSLQCVVPPVKRAGLLVGSGTPGACDGGFSQDLNALWCPTCPKPNHNPGAGAVVQAQLWYRDPASTSNQTTSLSNALEFPVAP